MDVLSPGSWGARFPRPPGTKKAPSSREPGGTKNAQVWSASATSLNSANRWWGRGLYSSPAAARHAPACLPAPRARAQLPGCPTPPCRAPPCRATPRPPAAAAAPGSQLQPSSRCNRFPGAASARCREDGRGDFRAREQSAACAIWQQEAENWRCSGARARAAGAPRARACARAWGESARGGQGRGQAEPAVRW